MRTIARLTGICAALLAAAGATAGPLSRGNIAADATWVAHADFDRLRDTAFGRYLLDEMQKPEAETRFAAFQAVYRFDPRRDLRTVTLYGVGANHEDAVALVNARFDADHLVTLVKANDTHQSSAHRQYTIHSWIDNKKMKPDGTGPRTYAAAHSSGHVVFGRTAELVGRGLDVLDGHARSLKDGGGFTDLDGAANAVFFLAGADFSAISTIDPKAAILQKTRSGRLTVGESGDTVELTARVEANDAATAGQIQSIAQGLIALMSLQTRDPNATRLAQATSIALNGTVVTATLRLPSADVIRLCREKHAPRPAAP
jgi:hypothetical protein